MTKREMSEPEFGPEDELESESERELRHRFAKRWKRKRELRSTRHAWKFIALDLTLLLVVLVLTWLLAKALE